MNTHDRHYLDIVLEPLRVCAGYKPRFGQGSKGEGLTLEQFQELYRADPFYNWFGLDNPMMYAAHKAAGGMTSIYRQIGIGCERFFRVILRDSLGLSDEAVTWSYETILPAGKKRTLYLDGRVPLAQISNNAKKQRFREWMEQAAKQVGVASKVIATLDGTVFEIRQGYKSKDAKRQNADIANAATAYTKAYLPCAAILSTQIDADVLHRYKGAKWVVLTGTVGANNPLVSTYDFMRDVVGYDLEGFFRRNSQHLRREVETILNALLTP
ncbi:hypothetical protein [Chloracidobacterium thermophilum]|uniref:hypothetical protein n=1 Tax=Chloracidobacterium thermophilum TaxID=458033 RepID=UPI0007387796|nr:hypothetical protein [Chloracidobacterium thermophilum]